MAATARLDLNNNDLLVQNGSLATLTALVASGFNAGAQNGNGIFSTAAANNASHVTTLGVIQNSVDGTTTGTTLYPGFDGLQTGLLPTSHKIHLLGDANLDGKVDGSDYSLIDSGFLTHATGWRNGDFNYDGTINGSDYTLIDNAFNTQGAQLTAAIASPTALTTAEVASVPEPAAAAASGLHYLRYGPAQIAA